MRAGKPRNCEGGYRLSSARRRLCGEGDLDDTAGHNFCCARKLVSAPCFGEQTVGSLFRNVWRVYRDHFVLIALTYFLPTFPLVAFTQMVRGYSRGLELALLFAYTVIQFVAGSALTVTLSDICLVLCRPYGDHTRGCCAAAPARGCSPLAYWS